MSRIVFLLEEYSMKVLLEGLAGLMKICLNRLSIVRKISGIGFQPVDCKSQAGSLCHNEEPTVISRSMLNLRSQD